LITFFTSATGAYGGDVRSRLAIILILFTTLTVGLLFARQLYIYRGLPRPTEDRPKVRLLTYSTFVGANGPGHEIIRRFEKENGCRVEIVSSDDAGLLLERLKLGQAGVPFDVVLGLDQVLLPDADAQFEWQPQPFAASSRNSTLAEFTHPRFIPYDWSPMSFVYRKTAVPRVPRNFEELTSPEYKGQIGLQDPRSSTPGLQFVQWVRAVEGAKTVTFLEHLKPNVHSVSPSWSFSYGLFKKEQVRFVFSYVTSLAYHWGIEKNRNFQILSFPEGHPVQVEYAGVPKGCRECVLAQKFVEELIKPWAQKLIMEKNFMFPVIKGLEDGTVFAELPRLKGIKTGTGKELGEWDKAFKN
jgi:thiamine transport system substrate-binding protein